MTAAGWGGLLLAWFAALALPGPDIFLLLRLGVRQRRAAVLAALGIMSGNLLWIVVSVLGLAALFQALPGLLPIMQSAGALVLGFLGAQSMRSGIAQLRVAEADRGEGSVSRPWLLGFTTNLANPKALIFFTALLAQFLPAGAGWDTRIAIIAAMVAVGVAWFLSIAIASSAAAFRGWFGRAAPWFDIVAGALFVVIAAAILAEAVLAVVR
ncbi:threonine transporter [Leucobacter sp. UCD-THU]|jgi:threonine/homoserine/homoserine lactone efflux protein|uniref:LysE family translocator n=1 Tax=Leucobacter muris TaxID=1935379 RepID=A0ABX5QF70_9MICO|nr:MULTISPECIES: LysE family translocator [Leucobacter]EYT52850.1 threonine transporter [Leucobacter sp. UCD-THU]QAB17658.1 LysE family translocator [Leucobacter muris]